MRPHIAIFSVYTRSMFLLFSPKHITGIQA